MLIDSGSDLTFVKEELLTHLNLQRTHSSISIIGIGGKKSTQTRGVVSLVLRSIHRPLTITVRAHVLRSVSSRVPSTDVPNQEWPHLIGLALADPEFLKPQSVDIIIGADTYGQIIKPNIIRGPPSMPLAQLSIFGWLVLGPIASSATLTQSSYHTSLMQDGETSIRDLLEKIWIEEELPSDTQSELTPEEQECEDHFKATHTRDAAGIVRIPFKSPASLLGNPYHAAHAGLKRPLLKFKKNDEYRELYQGFMSEYEDLNHMVRAPSISSHKNPIFYLPHHGVLKPDSKTTKLRVVFNGSCATTSGHSLNDLMHTGQTLLLNISDVLLWIRQHEFIFATDITKMYRQIRVHEDDQDLQRILWVDKEGEEIAFKLATVTYGTKAAPFLAVRALFHLTEDERHRFPSAIPSISHARYVDDIFGGADTGEQLIKIAQHLKDLCHAGGFPLAKWHSTHPALLDAISPNSRAQGSTISLDDCHTKILGLQWNSFQDNFTFSSKPNSISIPTKRIILSEVSQIIDPLGFLSPVIIRAKMILQELWLHKLRWDDPLPPQVTSHWYSIREDLRSLARLSIPRWFNTYSNSVVELHGFFDASQLAMAAIVYITVISPCTNLKVSTLVCAKTKVAPLKKLTIPRLELTTALMLAKLAKYVQATLQLNIESTHLWTDSQVALTWINSHASR